MFTRRSGRLNQAYSNLNQYHNQGHNMSPPKQSRTTGPPHQHQPQCKDDTHPLQQQRYQQQQQQQYPKQQQQQPQQQQHHPPPQQQQHQLQQPQQQQQLQQPQQQQQIQQQPPQQQQQRYFNSPQIQKLALEAREANAKADVMSPAIESPDKNVSATTKALNQAESDDKKKWKKGVKIPMAVRRKKLNQRLSKLLTPKSALILLHELKPGCVYKVQEQPGCIPPSFCAQVENGNVVIGAGQGLSKSQAKNSAAENAIKAIVSRAMAKHAENAAAGEAEKEDEKKDDQDDSPENLPWAGLASFAIYKMFSEWQNQGADLLPITRPIVKPKSKPAAAANAPTKKELPANAAELHPAVVLNMMNPGLTAVELEREDGPKCRVKMGYLIEGQMYTGIGGNKKDAKKEAAKAVLEGRYGLTYA